MNRFQFWQLSHTVVVLAFEIRRRAYQVVRARVKIFGSKTTHDRASGKAMIGATGLLGCFGSFMGMHGGQIRSVTHVFPITPT